MGTGHDDNSNNNNNNNMHTIPTHPHATIPDSTDYIKYRQKQRT